MFNEKHTEIFQNTGRVVITDKKITHDISKVPLINKQFVRVVASKIRFTDVDFSYSTFDSAYLRNCSFDSCNFTGCRFLTCNMSGSAFNGCKFDYASFDKTFIDNDILDYNCPGYENLKIKFARSLRLNYQQIGDAVSANKAITIELLATEIHHRKAWKSKEAYYRKKYKGFMRITQFIKWLGFKCLDFIWGNGESIIKLARTTFILLIAISYFHVQITGDTNSIGGYITAFQISPQILLGTSIQEHYSPSHTSIILVIRFVLFSFFVSIFVKRFNRR